VRRGARSCKDGAPEGQAVGGASEIEPGQSAGGDFPNTFTPIEAGLDFDLYGQPVDLREGRVGRPRHLPTEASRALVAAMRAEGADQLAIAAAIGISGPTLRLNYPQELGSRSTVWRRRAALGAQSKGPDDASA